MAPLKFVEPEAPNPHQIAANLLASGGWSPVEIEWLALATIELFPESTTSNGLLSERCKWAFEELAEARKQLAGSGTAIVYFADFAEREFPPHGKLNFGQFLRTAGDHGVDLLTGVAELHRLVMADSTPAILATWMNHGAEELGFRLRKLAKQLHEAEVADFGAFIRWDRKDAPDREQGWGPQRWPRDSRLADRIDPREASFWFHALGEAAASPMVEYMVTHPGPEFMVRLKNFVWSLSDWMTSHIKGGLGLPYFAFPELPLAVREAVEKLFFWAEPSLFALSKDEPLATPLLLRLERMAFQERSDHLTPEVRKSLFRLASDSFSRRRPLLREAHTAQAPGTFRSYPTADLRQDSIFLMFELGSLWAAWKPLLLAFRALSVPSLSPQLSFSESAGSPWNIIPSSLVMMFHHRARSEEADDPTLKSFRNEFGQFCLDSLKTLKDRKSPESQPKEETSKPALREPSAEWRFGYVRALMELRINPEGDGHRVLHWVSENDPDESVREVARMAYDEIRRGDRLGDMSPRRAVLQAFWWLEQAHMLALGQDVDTAGAQRTRERLVRMTTKKPEDLEHN